MLLRHTLKIGEDWVTISGRILDVVWEGNKRGDEVRHCIITTGELFWLNSTDFPQLDEDYLCVWWNESRRDTSTVEYEFESPTRAKEVMEAIMSVTVKEEENQKIAIHTPTKEEFMRTQEIMINKGWRRYAIDGILDISAHELEWSKTCIKYNDCITYCDMQYFKRTWYKVITFQKFLELEGIVTEIEPKKQEEQYKEGESVWVSDVSKEDARTWRVLSKFLITDKSWVSRCIHPESLNALKRKYIAKEPIKQMNIPLSKVAEVEKIITCNT